MDNNPEELVAGDESQPQEGAQPAAGEQAEGTAQTDAGASESTPKEDKFTEFDVDGVNLDSIPVEYQDTLKGKLGELQDAHKSMQSDYTKKTTGVAEREKEMDALKEKAGLYDNVEPMLNDPGVRKMLQEYEGKRFGTQAPQDENPSKIDYENMSPERKEALDLVREIVKEEIGGRISPLEDDAEQRRNDQYFDHLEKQYPDFASHADAIHAEVQKSGVDPETAYLRLTKPMEYQRGIDEAAEKQKVRKADSLQRTSAGANTVSDTPVRSWEDAVAVGERDTGK